MNLASVIRSRKLTHGIRVRVNAFRPQRIGRNAEFLPEYRAPFILKTPVLNSLPFLIGGNNMKEPEEIRVAWQAYLDACAMPEDEYGHVEFPPDDVEQQAHDKFVAIRNRA